MAGRFHLSLDEFHRWRVFDVSDALGDFGSWAEADAFRKTLGINAAEDSDPSWNQKSGGY